MREFGKITSIIGNSGSGKTKCFLLPAVKETIERNESFVLTDSKNEALAYLGGDLRRQGYRIVNLNLRDKNKGISWNPLWLPYQYYLNNDMEKCYCLLNSIATSIFNQGKNIESDPYWEISARDFFVGLCFALFEDATQSNQINLLSIYSMAMSFNDRIGNSNFLKKYFDAKKDKMSYSVSCVYGTVNAPNDTRNSIMSVFYQKIRNLIMNERYKNILCNPQIELLPSIEEKTAYIINYEDEIQESSFIAKIFIQQIINLLINRRDNTTEDFHVFFEDFLLLNYYSGLDNLLLSAKGRKINLYFSINNLAVLKKIYGEQTTSALLENCDKIIFTSIRNKESLDYVSLIVDDNYRLKSVSDSEALCITNHRESFLIRKKYMDITDKIGWAPPERIINDSIEIFSVEDIVKQQIELEMSRFEANNVRIDELIKNIDKKIAELEELEKNENERK